ncbi:MAG: hypothetical protein UY35_C0005G0019 [Candidatus Saccharibacteria bacterium GW2011_GWC2_48_9]|nr:MAG: hypothetical protein UY35_C0005G0019 [Candidatus Saccharibacteria bacterium GW2011_GWC2_48_9]HCH34182.1 transcriptional regulator [Candidatus Saccharibacteria bacterium]
MSSTHAHGYYENKQAILKRLRRAEGQVRGIANMVEEDKYCIDILTQISAARSALDKVAVELIRDHAKHCLSGETDDASRQHKADELADAIGRMITK